MGIYSSIVTASLLAVLSAVNRGLATLTPTQRQAVLPEPQPAV
ncbi:MAG: hypothetical protein WBG32_12605 [Nodosilinea sp.]